MQDRLNKIEIDFAKFVVAFEEVAKNTENLPEILRLFAVLSERSEIHSRDISAISKKVNTLEHDLPMGLQSANDRANTTSRWVFGIAIIYSTSLFGFFTMDMDRTKDDNSMTNKVVATHEKRLHIIEERYNILGMNYD